MAFPRQKYWSGLLFPAPGYLLNPEIKPMILMSPALTDGFLTTTPLGKPWVLTKPQYFIYNCKLDICVEYVHTKTLGCSSPLYNMVCAVCSGCDKHFGPRGRVLKCSFVLSALGGLPGREKQDSEASRTSGQLHLQTGTGGLQNASAARQPSRR